MPLKRKEQQNKEEEIFGKRLARLRKTAGYSQQDFASEIGISNRMVAYYEAQTVRPPSHLLPTLAKTLGVTIDQLFGMGKIKQNGQGQDTRLWRRFSQVEKLPPEQRKPIIQVIDSFLEREKFKNGVQK